MSKVISNGGITLMDLLGITFLVLKLTRVIDWPWIWVLAPFWIVVAGLVVAIVVMVLAAIVSVAVKSKRKK